MTSTITDAMWLVAVLLGWGVLWYAVGWLIAFWVGRRDLRPGLALDKWPQAASAEPERSRLVEA